MLLLPVRGRILECVARSPGLRPGEIAKRLGLDYKTVDYHLRILRRFGLVTEARVGVGRHVYPALSEASWERLPVLLQPTRRALFALVRAKPGVRLSQAARELGVSKATAHHHARRLAAWGLLVPDAEEGLRSALGEESAAGAAIR
ncbi:MAG TPA: helix-turn-helix domain-containing protein [Candidatus Thermoplasmatota archaeon]|nr:helix-turn-helix domain-containing protein [Candidatus Thermoplasmatota archaeon]